MIRSFKHRGLKALYEGKTARKVASEHIDKLRRILAVLDNASDPDGLNLPGFHLHPLKGDLQGFWAVTVASNWRVTFRFEENEATDVDYLDYH